MTHFEKNLKMYRPTTLLGRYLSKLFETREIKYYRLFITYLR